MQDPNDRPTAGELLKDPWLVGSQKTLKMSWNKAAGLARRGLKPREAHRTLASVVQRMIDHDHSDAAASRQGVLDDDSAEYTERSSSARMGSGPGGLMGMGYGDSRANSIGSIGSAAGEGGLLGRKEVTTGMLPPMPAYRDDTAKGRSTLSMMPVEEGQEEGNSATAVRFQLVCVFQDSLWNWQRFVAFMEQSSLRDRTLHPLSTSAHQHGCLVQLLFCFQLCSYVVCSARV